MTFSEHNPEQILASTASQDFVSGLELWQWWQQAKAEAIASTIPPSELEWLLTELAGLDRLTLRLETFKQSASIPLKSSLAHLQSLWQQRIQLRTPVQYLLGVVHWRQFTLQVSPAVLIPRPETELLIDLAIPAVEQAHFTPSAPQQWADLGTGSGAIALGLASISTAIIHAVDCSPGALAVARANAAAYQMGDRIQFYQGNWFEPLTHLQGTFNGIVSNPPYIPTAMVPALQPEVAQHEPHLALDGGADGLDSIRILIEQAPSYLQPGGVLLFEMMAGQAIAIKQLLNAQGSYTSVEIHADLAGIERFALAHRA